MRVAGGVLLLIIGLSSIASGGCSVAVSQTMSSIPKESAEVNRDVAKIVDDMATIYTGYRTAGLVTLIGGLLCVPVAILFFVNRGKTLGFFALGVAINGEVLSIVLSSWFSPLGWLKIAVLIFCAFAATQVATEARRSSEPVASAG